MNPTTESNFRETRWDLEGVDGRRSSQDIALDWLATANNHLRWLGSQGYQSQKSLSIEIHQIMVKNGINHRSVESKFSLCFFILNVYERVSHWFWHTFQASEKRPMNF